MKAIILAAGFGTRVGELTNYLPKPLIPVVNKPLIQHLIETLYKCGISEFIIAVGHLKDQLASFLYNLPGKNLSMIIKEARDFEKGPIYTFFACLNEIKTEEFQSSSSSPSSSSSDRKSPYSSSVRRSSNSSLEEISIFSSQPSDIGSSLTISGTSMVS